MREVPVKGFEEYYTISEDGIVTSYWSGFPKTLKNKKDKCGYFFVRISNGIDIKNIKIHRLVAMHFLDNPEDKPQVNHKNGVKSDNNVSNLEWVTISENAQHAYDTGLRVAHPKYGGSHHNAKIKDSDIPIIKERLARKETQISIARSYGVAHQQISCIKRGITWKNI